MEERVGEFWHRLITWAAATQHPHAVVTLGQVERRVSVLFRALGGEGGLRVCEASPQISSARRSWLQRMAGSQRKVALAWRDGETLRLPERIALFPDPTLNRELYLWLAALAAMPVSATDWFMANQQRTGVLLRRFPGIAPRYRRLLAAELRLRPELDSLSAAEADAEAAIRAALERPGSVAALPPSPRPPQPVYLWLHPPPGLLQTHQAHSPDKDVEPTAAHAPSQPASRQRRPAQRVDDPDGRNGLLAFRLESLFSWCEYLNLDRTTDDSPDPHAAQAADDLDVISVSRGAPPASRLRLDLDLPAAENDDMVVGEGIKLPEWDYRKRILLPDHCRLQPLVAAAPPCELPAALLPAAHTLRRQFQSLLPLPSWRRGEPEGCEIDLDAWLQHSVERRSGGVSKTNGLYRDFRRSDRQLTCLLLADLSLSTDAWVGDSSVIDVIRASLYLFSEALTATGDRFALYGFSSRRRDPIRFHTLKTFAEPYNASVRGRIHAIRPGYYTRMGAAIRYASILLCQQQASQRLLILLSDGKPNDLDQYEGRYGIEDTRMAVIEARRLGLEPFCVTIDEHANDYMPYLFGSGAYLVIRRPTELPRRLPLLYARLTR